MNQTDKPTGVPEDVKQKIEPCPFCGKEANIIKRGNAWSKKRSAEIKCSGCGAFMIVGAIRNSLEWCESSVIDDWNKRTPLAIPELTAKEDEIAKLKEEVEILRNDSVDLPLYDLSKLSEEDKKKHVDDIILVVAKVMLNSFIMLGLETHIAADVINDTNGDKFKLSFVKQ